MKHILRTLLAYVALCAIIVPGVALAARGRVVVPLCANYDLDSTSYVFVRTVGDDRTALSPAWVRPVKVKTTGSSVSLTAVTASSAPFIFNAAGTSGNAGGTDILYFQLQGQPDAAAPANINPNSRLVSRTLITKADNDNITVDTAIDLSNSVAFAYRIFQVGAAATDGWINMNDIEEATWSWQVQQSDAASIDVTIECEPFTSADNPYASRIQVFTKNLVTPYTCPSTAADGPCGSWTMTPNSITAPPNFDRCRMGLKITTDSSDAGANIEKISAQFSGLRQGL